MSPTVKIASVGEFSTLLRTSNVVITDCKSNVYLPSFPDQKLTVNSVYADWCGPCKAIAPTFESLSTKYSKPKAITFTKVDVDSQQQISQQYGVSAMPTFMIFHGGKTINTLRGADPRALTAAVEAAVKLAPAASQQLYSTPGRTLGGPGIKPAQSLNRPVSTSLQSLLSNIIAIFSLFIITLFSFDSYATGESSPFNIHRVPSPPVKASATSGTKQAAAPVRRVGTLSDITGES